MEYVCPEWAYEATPPFPNAAAGAAGGGAAETGMEGGASGEAAVAAQRPHEFRIVLTAHKDYACTDEVSFVLPQPTCSMIWPPSRA